MADLFRAICDRAVGPDPRTGKAPAWVHLLPLGQMQARDGRTFSLLDPEAVVAAFARNAIDLPIDFDHQSETPAAERSGPAPAAGWIKELRVASDGLWGRVEWTARAAELIGAKEYRFLSPSFLHRKDGSVVRLKGAGLVHHPALHLTALAAQEDTMRTTPERKDDTMAPDLMNLIQRLAEMLNLPGDASPDEMLAALQEALKGKADRTAPDRAAPDPSKYVPVAALADLLRDRNAHLATMSQSAAEAKVSDAMRRGYLTPAMKPWALALCAQDPASFDDFIGSAAPPYAHLMRPSHTNALPPGGDRGATYSALETSVCAQLGLPPGSLSS
jgi:phage I-like protein